jgi:GDPmannose 4,6-dehydratase|tara:strand:- start:914 stop:2086 length:1173 start_codon:yes stop_codon:yes gene_type:complete
MKAIIFGITGQDGSYLAEFLLEKGYDVIGVTRRVSVDTLQRISHILPQLNIIEGDITDAFSVSNIINEEKPDEIYNLAAQSHVGTSFKQPSLTWDVTAGGVLNILEAIRYSGRKEEIKFYQASSSEMFGKNFSKKGYAGGIKISYDGRLEADMGKKTEPLKFQDEDTPFAPQSPYAIAKLAAHHLVINYRDSYEIFGCSGILFNHESERRGEKFVTRKITKWIGDFLKWREFAGLEDETILTFSEDTIHVHSKADVIKTIPKTEFPKLRLGNLEARRDWGHAEDYVRAMWLMMQEDIPDDYVVATGHTHSIKEFLDTAFDLVGISDWDKYVTIDPEFYRPSEVDYLLGSPLKANTVLDWKPEVAFVQLVQRMVESDTNETKLQRPSLQGV